MQLRLGAYLPYEELDYVSLKNILSDYSCVRDKISALLQSGELIRVKKGLYVLGPTEAHKPYSKELLANLIYGPSYLSLDYALSFHGIIPERVEVLTSVSSKKDKYFETPIGHFSYRYLNVKKYAIGIMQEPLDREDPFLMTTSEKALAKAFSGKKKRYFLMATPEKALADKIVLDSPSLSIQTFQEMRAYLLEDLRCNPKVLHHLDLQLLQAIADVYQKDVLFCLVKYLFEANHAA